MATIKHHQLTASELISALQKEIARGGDRPVMVSGCDCYGEAAGLEAIELDEFNPAAKANHKVKSILIKRTDDR